MSFLNLNLAKKLSLIAGSLVMLFALYNIYTSFIKTYPIGELSIENNSTSYDLVEDLEEMGISVDFYELRLIQRLFGHGISAGTYQFTNSPTLYQLSGYISDSQFLITPNRLSIPEGFNNEKILNRLDTLNLPRYSRAEFEVLIADKEGYLFPDTYLLKENITASELLSKITNNFNRKTSIFEPLITRDEVILASIVEREVSNTVDRKLVADILLRRLEIGMRLQVDASLDYYLDKASDEITVDELQEDHPYNTYRNYGLPPTAISNPGIDSMQSVREPTPNNYWFYLSAPDGTTYFAETFQQHVENKERYL